MLFSTLAAALALAAPLAEAHGGVPGAPKIFGMSNRPARVRRAVHPEEPVPELEKRVEGPHLDPRANTDGPCGSGRGTCAPGYCCSAEGYCGQSSYDCSAPDCQLAYGSGCDGNKVPAGASTYAGGQRSLPGSIPYGGAGIYDCIANGVVALTFDDGPYIYTSGVLDLLKAAGAKATFFVTGINIGKGAIDDPSKPWPALIRRMYAEGHQIASHSWSHQDLSVVNAATRQNQMVYNEMALRNILGFYPTYMRPPYSSCNGNCQSTLRTLGYHITYFDLDTDDYNNITPETVQNAKNNFANPLRGTNPANTDFLAIAHDIHQQTAQNLTQFMLDTLKAGGYRAVTVGECLNDPPANWYRSAGGGSQPTSTSSTTTPPPSSTSTSTPPPSSTSTPPKPITTNAKCGSNGKGATCQGSQWGNCCSRAGWCGSTPVYCQLSQGCQTSFGTCTN